MNAIVKARDILSVLVHHSHRYDQGELDAVSYGALVDRTRRQLERACWCDEGVCCQIHEKHSQPHKKCVLR